MKAKAIKYLRKRIGKIQTYTIRETFSLFGDFFGHNRIGHTCSDTFISATSPIRAIEIYMRNYRKEYKQINEHEYPTYVETKESWGRIMVVDESGFKRFYK